MSVIYYSMVNVSRVGMSPAYPITVHYIFLTLCY